MKTAWRIFIRDLRRLSTNIIAITVLVGICILPSLYAWLNIYVNMDPYANTSNIRIAVANNDQGSKDDLVGQLNAGQSLEKKLKENDKLGWVFTSEEAAIEGVRSGDYYAAIVIPESFSRDLCSVFSDKIRQPKITYYSNVKKNAIAPKITDSGASTILQGINEEFVASLTETVAEIVQEKAAEKETDLEDSTARFKKAIQKASSSTGELDALLQEFRNIKDDGENVINDGHDALNKASDLATKTDDAVDNAQARVISGWDNLNNFSSKLRKGINKTSEKLTSLHGKAGEDLGALDSKVRELDQELNGKLEPVVTKVQKVIQLNSEILEGLTELNTIYPNEKVSAVLSDLKENNERHQQILSLLQTASKGASDMYDFSSTAYSAINKQFTSSHSSLQNAITTFDNNLMDSAGTALASASESAGHLKGLTESVQTDIDGLDNLLKEISQTLESTDTALNKTQDALKNIRRQLQNTEDDIETIENMQVLADLKDAAQGIDAGQFGTFMSSPVELKNEVFYEVDNYGSGMAPFYTNLAIWVGCVVLINLFKLDVDEDEKLNHFNLKELYFGRWFIFVFTALIQAVITCVGNLFIPGLSCKHPLLFVLAGMWTSFVFMNIVYALTATFKHVGKALCVLLVILQVPGSAGTYPIEMSPSFFRAIHPFLPFTYGVAAAREAMAGLYGNDYQKNLAILAVFIPLSLFIGLLLRPLFVNLNYLFDHRMAETDLLTSERNGLILERPNITAGMRLLFSDKTMRGKLLKKIERFDRNYPRIVRHAFLLVVIVPTLFLILMLIMPAKLVFLILWVGVILLVVLFLLIVEYLKDHLDRQRKMIEMPPEKLVEVIKENKD